MMVFYIILLVTALFASCQAALQHILKADHNTSSFKNYHIRVKRPISCEKSIQYSGYIDNLETHEHIYFLFLVSRFAPKTDPIVLSLNGQLGCSSAMSAWFDTGLCLVTDAGIETNPFSLSNIANVLYIDQPSDVGYSYTTGKKLSTSIDTANSIYWFLQAFFTEFYQYSNNDFHIASTSYASHVVPILARKIIKENRYTTLIKIPLKSIILGNGYIDPLSHQLSYADYVCADNTPIFDKWTCQKMMQDRRHCALLLNSCNSCTAALMYCRRTLEDPFYRKRLNPFDIRQSCLHSEKADTCYPVVHDIVNYANLQSTRTELGVDTDAGEFTHCNKHVFNRFHFAKDDLVSVMPDIEKLLAYRVRVLVYAGDRNWYNNYLGQLNWLSSLDWIGQVEFNHAEEKDWYSYVSGSKAGYVKSVDHLFFVKIFNAGLYAMYDQPENMIDLYSRWLFNISLTSY